MKNDVADDAGASGIRVGALHVSPSAEVESTMSFRAHEARKRQSCHTA